MKTCKRCGCEKPLSAFSPRKDAKDGLAYWCTPCKTAATKSSPRRKQVTDAYYASKREECIARSVASMQKKPSYYAAKQAEWAAKNRERVLAMRRAAYAKNPAPEIERVRRRQRRIRGATPWVGLPERAEMEGLYRFCQIFKGFEVDHILPLNGKTVSGLHVPGNLQVLTVRANRQKGAKMGA